MSTGSVSAMQRHVSTALATPVQDARRFGRIAVYPTPELDRAPELTVLGPDALGEPISAERLNFSISSE